MDPITIYQHCHDLQYDSFDSIQGLLESIRDYQRMAPQKLSDANLESVLCNKVPIKLQKEDSQMTEGSLQELFRKMLKAEEVVKERERSSHRGSVTCKFRGRYRQRTLVQGNNYTSGQKNTESKQGTNATSNILNVSDVVRKGMLLNHVMLLLTRFVLNKLIRVYT